MSIESSCAQKQSEIDELCAQLDQQTSANQTQQERGKRLDAEIAQLRRRFQESNASHQSEIRSTKFKSQTANDELNDQIAALKRYVDKCSQENRQLRKQIAKSTKELEETNKAKTDAENTLEPSQEAISELRTKSVEQQQDMEALNSVNRQVTTEIGELRSRQKELEQELAEMLLAKTYVVKQLNEVSGIRTDESGKRQAVGSQIKNLESEKLRLQATLEDEMRSTDEARRKLAEMNAELGHYKGRFNETNTLVSNDTVESLKRQYNEQIEELRKRVEDANFRIVNAEKDRMRMLCESEDIKKEVDRYKAIIAQSERRSNQLNAELNEWKRKVSEVSQLLDEAQRNAQIQSADLYGEQTTYDKLITDMQSVEHENQQLQKENNELGEQLVETSKMLDETRKLTRNLDMDKHELQQTIDQTETLLEMEQGKLES
ncbi:unnamed protein product, partial [Anisakis simplex]